MKVSKNKNKNEKHNSKSPCWRRKNDDKNGLTFLNAFQWTPKKIRAPSIWFYLSTNNLAKLNKQNVFYFFRCPSLTLLKVSFNYHRKPVNSFSWRFNFQIPKQVSPYQSDTEKEDLENSSNTGWTDNVTIADCGHGDHEKVNTFPITQFVNIAEIGRISAVLQLE